MFGSVCHWKGKMHSGFHYGLQFLFLRYQIVSNLPATQTETLQQLWTWFVFSQGLKPVSQEDPQTSPCPNIFELQWTSYL